MDNNRNTLRSIVENIPIDQALEYVVSELGTYLTKIHTALNLLDKAHPELDANGKSTVQIAQAAALDMTQLIDETIKDVLLSRLRTK